MGFSEPDGAAAAGPGSPMPCELIMPRAHPDGGVQLMVPENWSCLRPIVIEKNTDRVVVKPEKDVALDEGIWSFMKVDDFIPAPISLDSEGHEI